MRAKIQYQRPPTIGDGTIWVPWFRLDDAFDTHPKVLAAGNEAIGLFIRCGTYAARNLTDGFVPRSVVLLYGDADLAAKLVDCGLWHRVRTGWMLHDYLKYNPSKEAVEKQRDGNRRRQAAWRNGVSNGVSVTAPTRPVGTTDEASTTGGPPRKLPKHNFEEFKTTGVVATRQPPPFAEANERALHPDTHASERDV